MSVLMLGESLRQFVPEKPKLIDRFTRGREKTAHQQALHGLGETLKAFAELPAGTPDIPTILVDQKSGQGENTRLLLIETYQQSDGSTLLRAKSNEVGRVNPANGQRSYDEVNGFVSELTIKNHAVTSINKDVISGHNDLNRNRFLDFIAGGVEKMTDLNPKNLEPVITMAEQTTVINDLIRLISESTS